MPWSSRAKPPGRAAAVVRAEPARSAPSTAARPGLAWETRRAPRAELPSPAGAGSGLRPSRPSRRPEVVRRARRARPGGPGAARARRRAAARRRPAPPGTRAARGRRDPAEELLARRLLSRGGGRLAARRGRDRAARRPHDAEPVDELPELATADARPGAGRPGRGRRRLRGGTPGRAAARPLGHCSRRRRCAPAGSGSATCGRPPRSCTSTSRRRRCWSSWPPAAGLLAVARRRRRQRRCWLPTDAFDAWAPRPAAERWVAPGPGLAGQPADARAGRLPRPAGKAWNALAPGLVASAPGRDPPDGAGAAGRRCPPGEVLATGTGVPSLVARVAWLRPRRPRDRADQVAWAVDEAAVLGVTGLGGARRRTPGRCSAGDEAAAAAALAPLLPEPVDHVLLQADLTAVAPGPLEPSSPAGCSWSPTSSRAAAPPSTASPRLGAPGARRRLVGRRGARVPRVGVAHTGPAAAQLPRRRHRAHVRHASGSGYAEAFLRADDEAALTELLHHPRPRTLGLRRIAPTVLVSTTPLDVLLPRLRELGAAPVVEAADGTVRVARPDVLRARSPASPRRPGATRPARPPRSPRRDRDPRRRPGRRRAGPRSAPTADAERRRWPRCARRSRPGRPC